MGLLAGLGFVLFSSLLGIANARVADRLNRRNIVAIAFAIWSLMTAPCGMASSVMSLALAATSFLVGCHLGPIFAIAQTARDQACGRWPRLSSR
jgi:MFS family permease